MLFPVTLAAVYWRRATAWAGFSSILVGEALVVLYHFKLLPAFGFLPVIPVILVTTLVLVVGSLLWPAGRLPLPGSRLSTFARPTAHGWRWAAVFGFVFLAASDFWAWRRPQPSALGLPLWLWYHAGLILVSFLLIVVLVRPRPESGTTDDS